MERQLFILAVALGGLYLVGKHNVVATIRRGGGFTEVADNVFAIKNARGEYLRCEDAEGNTIDDSKCKGCGASIFGVSVPGCPGGSTGDLLELEPEDGR